MKKTLVLDPATAAKAARMEKRLRHHHALGRKANGTGNGLSVEDLTSQYAINEHTLRKIRAFAREYTQKDLDELCKLRRPNGLPLQWGHIPYLLIVKDKQERKRLQERAAREGWTAPMLNAAIPQKYRLASGHGRTMAPPASLEAGLQQLILEGEHWARRCSLVMQRLQAEPASKLGKTKVRQLGLEAAQMLDRVTKEARAASRAIKSRFG